MVVNSVGCGICDQLKDTFLSGCEGISWEGSLREDHPSPRVGRVKIGRQLRESYRFCLSAFLPSGDCNLLCFCHHCCLRSLLASKPSFSLWTESSQASITTAEAAGAPTSGTEQLSVLSLRCARGHRGASAILLNSYSVS